MTLVQQRKQAKIGFETFRSKYIKLCVSSDVGKKEIRSERKRTCFLRRSNMRFSICALSIRAASLVTVCQWVKESWQELSKEMVERSFKKCGISNALDGTEDDLVWEEEEDSSQVEEEPDCDVYDDRITPEQWQELFGESDDEEEFHGF